MRLFNITHPKYTGTVKVVYGVTGQIQAVDFAAAQIPAELIKGLKNAVPVHVSGIEKAEGFGPDATIVEGSFEVTFEMFWNAYAQKINKLRAEKQWNRLSKTDQVLAYYGIVAYNDFLKRTSWRKRADPDTYLGDRYWLNEYK